MDIDRIISILRTLKEEGGMTTGSTASAAGFSGSADPKGPVAGYDPVMQFDGRSKMARRLPPPYKTDLIKKKKGKRKS
jgi:hypothetical protein